MCSKNIVAQMPPQGYFMPYAKRYAKNRFFLRRNPYHPFGGMWLIQRFCNKLRLRWLIQKYVRTQSRTAFYHPAEMVMALIVAIIMGLRRINKARYGVRSCNDTSGRIEKVVQWRGPYD
jgi:hypothetical protein